MPPPEILQRCDEETVALFQMRTTERSGNVPEIDPTPARAGGRERLEASGKRLEANGVRERFSEFWKLYPRKVGKDAAWRSWQKRRPSADLTSTILAALAWQKQQDNWLREGGRYVPNPATWINQGRWDDEPSEIPRINDRTLAVGRAGQEFLND